MANYDKVMQMIKTFIRLSFLLCISTHSVAETLKFVLISHTYYVNRYPDIQDRLVASINREKAAYIFALGDVALFNRNEDWDQVLEFFGRFNTTTIFTPGNHDLFRFDIVEGWGTTRFYSAWRENYRQRIGYLNKHVKDKRADLILINSVDPFIKTKPFLDHALEEADPSTPTYLLTHQRIWLERYQDHWIHWYWKGIRREEALPYIPLFDHLIIGDLWGKLEHMEIEGTPTSMIGMGNRDKPVFYVVATLQGEQLKMEQRTISLPPDHPYNN